MKLDNLLSKTETSLQLDHPTIGPVPVWIYGYTTASEEFRKISREVMNPNNEPSEIIIEDGRQIVESDPDTPLKRRKILAMVVTKIKGIDGFKFSPEAVIKLFDMPEFQWAVNQWDKHLGNQKTNFEAKESA